ncbi:hypothetical protein [Spongiactinospora sp. TRM90649]|uniref:hypothetical protein n=1 Tax=Spongiactinospora sp. TRM90649 TaxID=3031114 RepID=UPI0023F66F3F|nr:hypothetical protein [Spongiactinospora sp. TRM90649]MDF5758601.1 hypothetical protein [Spongiactinospora sp. TRM90649]
MAFAQLLREAASPLRERVYRWTGRTELAEQVRRERDTRQLLAESIAELEARMAEPGWQRLTALAEQEFTREGLRVITAVCRVMAIKNPLIKRGLGLRQAYVWGAGVEISARAPDVNRVIQQFNDANENTLTGGPASEELERALGTDGNVFIACFTSPRTGRVKARTLPWDEITSVIRNPEDNSEPWYYRRDWWEERIDPASGGVIETRRTAYYPALGYRPTRRPKALVYPRFGDTQPAEVMWDAPVYHVRVGGHLHWKWGVPDAYAAIDWAQAYRVFLEDWARLVKALSRFAWRLTSPGSKQTAAKARLAAAPSTDPVTGEARHSGATAMLTPNMQLEAIPKSGATIDSESGRPLAAMVAAALDLPVTMLLGDPGVTGARATAETLDTPTERAMELRRGVWTQARRAIYAYVIAEAVRAVDGPLDGTITTDPDGREVVTLAGGADDTIDISWPDLDDIDVETTVKAIVAADQTTYLPPLVVARLLLEALGVTDVDQILDTLTDEAGEFVPPRDTVGQTLADRFRRGEDPAAVLDQRGGPPTQDEEDDEEEVPAGAGDR